MLNVYRIEPFCGPRFRENERRIGANDTPCAICGKAVAKPYRHTAVVVHGGTWARTEAEEQDEGDAGYMGAWPIGPDCHRKYVVKQEG